MLITNIKGLVGVWPSLTQMVKGSDMATLPIIENAFLKIEEGRVVEFGSMNECSCLRGDYDAQGRYVMPSFCDSHTHLVYATSRHREWIDRLQGLSYEQIAERGGGILNSSDKLRTASEDELYESAAQRVQTIMEHGTGAVEIKSGYGLSLESELKMLRVIRRLKESFPITIKSTFLAAHAVGREFSGRQEEYVKHIIKDMLPIVAGEGLADFVDVFCDKGFFTLDQTRAILEASEKYNIKGKIHANELAPSGGVELAVEMGCLSADHLERMDESAFNALLSENCQTMPTALPGASFFLGIPYSPLREFIGRGLPVALASDYNPGSAPSGNMQLIGSLACTQAKLLPSEALTASTINSASAMGVSTSHGTIEIGKDANLVITKKCDSWESIYYDFGVNSIEKLITPTVTI